MQCEHLGKFIVFFVATNSWNFCHCTNNPLLLNNRKLSLHILCITAQYFRPWHTHWPKTSVRQYVERRVASATARIDNLATRSQVFISQTYMYSLQCISHTMRMRMHHVVHTLCRWRFRFPRRNSRTWGALVRCWVPWTHTCSLFRRGSSLGDVVRRTCRPSDRWNFHTWTNTCWHWTWLVCLVLHSLRRTRTALLQLLQL